MTPDDPRGTALLLYGLGRSGLAAGRLAARQGARVSWYDRDPDGPHAAAARAEGWTHAPDPLASDARVCIAAPGVGIDHADLQALRRGGCETIGEVEWVYRTVDAPIVGVTGTAGKGAVTLWIRDLLLAAGLDAVAGGNLDPALAEVARPHAFLSTELSSFQLERSPTLHPRVAVITVLGRDHLDRHGTVAAYHAVKRRLLTHLGPGDVAVLNADDPHQRAWHEGHAARVVRYSEQGNEAAQVRLEAGRIQLHGHDLGPVAALQPQGPHHRANLLAALAAADAVGADHEVLRRAVPQLRTPPGRFETVAEREQVRFVEDSVATRELAVRAALTAAEPAIAWILGGRDKGSDPAALRDLLPGRVALAVGIGEAGDSYLAAIDDLVPVLRLDHDDGRALMREAVRRAADAVRQAGGGTVLLSPLGASFDRYRDHIDRGAAFREAVTALLKEGSWTASC